MSGCRVLLQWTPRQPTHREIETMGVGASQTAVDPDWSALESTVSACTQCSLHRTRTQTVFGVGDPGADG